MRKTMPNLADQYAHAKAELDRAEAALKTLRKAILATGQEMLAGHDCYLQITLAERATLDTAYVRGILTPEQLASAERRTLVETIRIKPMLRVAA
jgi:hypothetical protein